MNGENAILQAIESLTEEVRCGFERMEERTEKLEDRVNAHDRNLTQIRTIWAGGTFLIAVTWDTLKAYIFGGPHAQR